MHRNFRYDSEISRSQRKYGKAKFSLGMRIFCYHCDIFAILAKFSLCHSKKSLFFYATSYTIQLAFLHFQLDISSSRLHKIAENSYELRINQHQYEAKLGMMVEVYKTCKTTKKYLEKKLVLLMDLHMSIDLINMISDKPKA